MSCISVEAPQHVGVPIKGLLLDFANDSNDTASSTASTPPSSTVTTPSYEQSQSGTPKSSSAVSSAASTPPQVSKSNGSDKAITTHNGHANGHKQDDREVVLYWTSGWGSPPCMRLMIALAEKHLLESAVKIHLNLMAGEHRMPDIAHMNPRMQVPILQIGGVTICESLASCLFVEDEFKDIGTSLIPESPIAKAQVLQRAIEVLNLENKTRDVVLPLQLWLPENMRQPIDPKKMMAAKENLANELKLWEGYLAQNSTNEFIAGPSFSLADAVFLPSLAWLVRYGFSLNVSGWENLNKYYESITQRPSVQSSWPSTWKTPIDVRIFDGISPHLEC